MLHPPASVFCTSDYAPTISILTCTYDTVRYLVFSSVGPPYFLEKGDLRRLTKTWCTFVPRYVRYAILYDPSVYDCQRLSVAEPFRISFRQFSCFRINLSLSVYLLFFLSFKKLIFSHVGPFCFPIRYVALQV